MIEEAIRQFPIPTFPASLYEPIRYFMALPGKRIRPIFVLQALELFREPRQEDAHAALATELFHNFSLVHDDIMDKADLRRGFLTVHKKWNEPTALLSGDAMLVLAYQALASAHVSDFKLLFNSFNNMALGVCEGQQLDMDFSGLFLIKEEEYVEMINRKTGILIAFSFEMAGFLAGLPEVERARLKAFGQAMGHCFQLRDDYLDLFGLEEKTGKKRGGDIGNRKLTLPVLFALNHPNGNPFKVWWNQKTADSEERIQACLSWMEDNQIPEKTLKVLNSEMTKGMELLEQIEGNPDAKIKLAELCKLLAYREK